jgi:hypothetical protein
VVESWHFEKGTMSVTPVTLGLLTPSTLAISTDEAPESSDEISPHQESPTGGGNFHPAPLCQFGKAPGELQVTEPPAL